MSSIKVKETRASRLRAGKTYSTRSSTPGPSQPNRITYAQISTTSSTTPTTIKKWPCGGCKKTIGKGNSVCCDGTCNKWFHAECVGISDHQFKVLRRDDHAEWKCTSCLTAVSHAAVVAQHTPGPLSQAIADLRLAAESTAVESNSSLPTFEESKPSDRLTFGTLHGEEAVTAWN